MSAHLEEQYTVKTATQTTNIIKAFEDRNETPNGLPWSDGRSFLVNFGIRGS
jgi:hypothetical protein